MEMRDQGVGKWSQPKCDLRAIVEPAFRNYSGREEEGKQEQSGEINDGKQDNSMQQLKAGGELVQMRENVRQAVQALEVCWRCQRVSGCQKYVLGNMVMVWLCAGCLTELHQPQCVPSKSRNHTVRSRETVSRRSRCANRCRLSGARARASGPPVSYSSAKSPIGRTSSIS